MERRDFFKISAVAGAAAALDGCGSPERQLIRFIPEEELTPGVAAWKPSVCTLCPAGCGLMVRVMEGDAEVVRNGKPGLIRMGLAKKLEGNPRHPVNQGKLCPRGQAGLQVTYNPDRVRHPLRSSGRRGSGQFREVSWDDALKQLMVQLSLLRSTGEAAPLIFLTRPLRGQRRELIERFLKAYGAPPPVSFELFDEAVLRRANFLSFGRAQLPTLDLTAASYVISFGADLLGAWNSPVSQAIGYGEMRQGRPGVRGKLVQVEARMSLTGASADEWIAARPGTEGALALGLAHVILNEGLRKPETAGRAGALVEGWSDGLQDYTPEAVERLTAVAAARTTRLARELVLNQRATAIIGGAPLAQTNGLFNALAVNALNALLGSVGQAGGIFFTARPPLPSANSFPATESPQGGYAALRQLVQEILLDRPLARRVLLLYEANPVFALPPESQVRAALERIPFIVSFGSFIDETSVMADLILPDHSPLESWLDDVPESGTTLAVAALAPPVMRPLHDTRAMPDVLLDIAHQLGDEVAAALPWKTYDEMLRATFDALREQSGSVAATTPEDFWKQVQEQGGWWSAAVTPAVPSPDHAAGTTDRQRGKHQRKKSPPHPAETAPPPAPVAANLVFDGGEQQYPFNFLPYASQMLLDGSLAHLPWMQETPDPLSTAMWGAWVEINPKTAERLGIRQGDVVEIASQHGKVQAPALVSPGIAPDVVAMPVGQGHENFGRYASRRGANPLQILAPMVESETGAFAWAATRVKIARVGPGKLVLFAGGLREKPFEGARR